MRGRISLRQFASWRDLFNRFIRRKPKQEEKIVLPPEPEPLDDQEILDEQKEVLQTLDSQPKIPKIEVQRTPKQQLLLTPYTDLLRSPILDKDGRLMLEVGKIKKFGNRDIYERWLANYVKKRRKELRNRLTPHQYYMTQCQGAMERPFTGQYWQLRDIGMYSCRICTQRLFSFAHKYDSPTGHASFWNFISKAIAFKSDHLELPHVTQSYVPLKHKGVQPVKRCVCSNCGSHLGFAFDDGPPPFFKRFSINSGALRFIEKGWLTPPPEKNKIKAKIRAQERSKADLEEEKKFQNMRRELGLL